MLKNRSTAVWVLLAVMSVIAGCGENETVKPKSAAGKMQENLSVGGMVTGMQGSGLVLQLNGSNDLILRENGKFNFPGKLAKGSSYTVSVKSAPTTPLRQVCAIKQASGKLDATVTSVAVNCSTATFAVGGTVTGLVGKGLSLQLNGETEQVIEQNGDFVFSDVRLADGSDYRVAIRTMPARQTCTLKPVNSAPSADTLNVVEVRCSRQPGQ